MIKSYNIDEFNIFNFCTNTAKAFNKDLNKFHLFKNLLHTFHLDEELYENSFEEYSSFISYSVIRTSIISDKNILQYEQYVFSTLSGYYKFKYNKTIDSKLVAKVWSNIIKIFNNILEISSKGYSETFYYNTLYSTFRHLNSKVNNCSYSAEIPIIFNNDNEVDIVLIVPQLKNTYYNILIPFLLKYFNRSLKNIHIFELSLSSINYKYTHIPIDTTIANQYRKFNESLFLDFNKINYFNCNICSLSCDKNELLTTRYLEIPYKKNLKVIKVRNI